MSGCRERVFGAGGGLTIAIMQHQYRSANVLACNEEERSRNDRSLESQNPGFGCLDAGNNAFDAVVTPANGESFNSRLGKLESEAGNPVTETVEKLYDEMDFQRAVQGYLWALLMVSYGAVADDHRALGADNNREIIADKLAEPRHLALTAIRYRHITPAIHAILAGCVIRPGPDRAHDVTGAIPAVGPRTGQELCTRSGVPVHGGAQSLEQRADYVSSYRCTIKPFASNVSHTGEPIWLRV